MNDEQTELLVNAILMIEQRLCTMSDVMTELLVLAQHQEIGDRKMRFKKVDSDSYFHREYKKGRHGQQKRVK